MNGPTWRWLLMVVLWACIGILAWAQDAEEMGAVEAAEQKGIVWMTSYEKALEAAKAQNRLIMIDVYADWCGWCKVLDEETYTDAKVIELARNMIALKIDAEKERDLVGKFNIRGLPTILFIDKDEKVVKTIVGYRPADKFAAELEDALKKAPAAPTEEEEDTASPATEEKGGEVTKG